MSFRASLVQRLNQFPAIKRLLLGLRALIFPRTLVSSHYIPLSQGDASAEGQRLRASWQDSNLPARQLELVQQQLQRYRAGARIDVFDVFVQSLKCLPETAPGMSLLEIGCSSGFYSEVLDIHGLPFTYSGCDYSSAFIDLAKQRYPGLQFTVEDATRLLHADNAFDVVVSGCCLLHIPEYPQAVAETARVARRYAVFHRTPVVWGQTEQWYRKKAYGIETVEIHFNEPEFLALLQSQELELIATYTLHEIIDPSNSAQGHAVRTYVCRKKVH